MNALAVKPAILASTPGRQVRRAHMRLNRTVRNTIARYGIGIGEFQLLRALYHIDGLTQTELSDEVEVEHGALTRLFHSMEATGFIRRERDADDFRKRHVFLTARGKALRAPLLKAAESINAAACSGISSADVAITLRVLDRIVENLDGWKP
jgi:DNA-binding MarR family transcriptional regulator